MSLWDRVSSWWHRDTRERAEEEAENRVTPAERDEAEEDYEAHQDEKFVDEHFGLDGVDFERDAEPPSDPAP